MHDIAARRAGRPKSACRQQVEALRLELEVNGEDSAVARDASKTQ